MEHVYAALLLNEANRELNEANLTSVLEAAGCPVVESRTKALVAALEGVDVDRIGDVTTVTEGADAAGDGSPEVSASGAVAADEQGTASTATDDAGGASDPEEVVPDDASLGNGTGNGDSSGDPGTER